MNSRAAGNVLGMHAEVDLVADASAPSRAREFLFETLRRWHCFAVDPGDAAVIVSELATNAVRYDGARLQVGLRWDSHGVQLHVHDSSTSVPTLPHHTPDLEDFGESGRGMTIIDSLALDWGTALREDGKSVWALLATAPPAP